MAKKASWSRPTPLTLWAKRSARCCETLPTPESWGRRVGGGRRTSSATRRWCGGSRASTAPPSTGRSPRTQKKRRSRAPAERRLRSPVLRNPRPVPLVAEQDQLFPGVPVEDLPCLRAEPAAPVPDHALAQKAPFVLLPGGPAGLALEG